MRPYGIIKGCRCCHYGDKGSTRQKGKVLAQEEPVIKYCCNFCTEDIADTNGRTLCPAYCFEEKIGRYPHNVTGIVLENAADPDCEDCSGKGHIECGECSGDGWVTYECHYGVGEVEWSPRKKKRGIDG